MAAAWRFYGHPRCGCCARAAEALMDQMRGTDMVLRLCDAELGVPDGMDADDAPMLATPDGTIVWYGAFDATATWRAWEETRRMPDPNAWPPHGGAPHGPDADPIGPAARHHNSSAARRSTRGRSKR